MLDANWKTWIVLAVAAIGVSFEVLKHFPPTEDSVVWQRENLRYTNDGKPYSIREIPKSESEREHRNKIRHAVKVAQVGGNTQVLQDEVKKFEEATKPTQTEAEHKDANAKVKKKKKSDDEYEEVIDPVTGKKVRRKKKKDVKKDEKPKEIVKPEMPKPNVDEDINSALSEVIAIGGAPQQPKKKGDDPFATLEEWERRLLSRPDLTETRRFIDQFRSNMVSATIFYKIAQLMVEDPRPEMKQLGLLCAGSVISMNSFQIITGVEKSNASSSLRSQATDLVAKYGEMSNLTTLKSVLQSSDSYSSMRATQLVDNSAQYYLRLTNTTTTTQQATPSNPNPPPQPTVNPQAAANANAFKPFIPILQQLAQRTRDSNLIGQCQRTIADIQALLSRTTPTSTSTSAVASTNGQ